MITGIILTLLLMPCFAESEQAYSVAVASSLLTESVPVGDTATVRITVRFMDNPVFWVWDSLTPPQAMGLDFIGSAAATKTAAARQEKSGETAIELRFSPTRTGQLTISPWQWRVFHIPNGDTTQIDTVSLSLPGHALVGLPRRKSAIAVLPLIMAIIGFALSVSATMIARTAVRKSRKTSFAPPSPPSPEQRATVELESLSPHRVKTGDILDALARIIRKYISEKLDIPAIGMSTDEILKSVSERGIGGHRFVALQQLLKYCDDVRFAKKYPDAGDVEEAIKQAKIFVGG